MICLRTVLPVFFAKVMVFIDNYNLFFFFNINMVINKEKPPRRHYVCGVVD